MKYLILIHQQRGMREHFASLPADQQASGLAAYQALNESLVASGEYVAAEALADDAQSSSVRVVDGQVQSTDGPFAETKELLAGFYLVDVDSLERAVEIGASIPEASFGARIEVRPVLSYDAVDM